MDIRNNKNRLKIKILTPETEIFHVKFVYIRGIQGTYFLYIHVSDHSWQFSTRVNNTKCNRTWYIILLCQRYGVNSQLFDNVKRSFSFQFVFFSAPYIYVGFVRFGSRSNPYYFVGHSSSFLFYDVSLYSCSNSWKGKLSIEFCIQIRARKCSSKF